MHPERIVVGARTPEVAQAVADLYLKLGSPVVATTLPAAELIKKAAGLAKGSATPHTTKVGKLTKEQVREIATTKQPDLNANDIDAAMKIIAGSARSLGLEVRD